jgi:hypothetical protein
MAGRRIELLIGEFARCGETRPREESRLMSISDEAGTTRQFVASGTAYTTTWEKFYGPHATKYWMVGFFVIVGFFGLATMGPTFGLRLPIHGAMIPVGYLFGLLILGVVVAVNLWRASRRKYVIAVHGDGITIDGQRDYSFADAQLGLWATAGVVLHLRNGRHQFCLAGRDRRISPTTQLDAQPVQFVDAWLPESDFDTLLSLSGRWSESVGHGPAASESTRCLLYPNALQMQTLGPFAFGKKQRLQQSLGQPQLFVDLDSDTIRVLDATTNALIGSAPIPQVTSSPATYKLGGAHMFPSAENLASDAMGQYFSTSAALSLCVPGMQPLTIGCRNFTGMTRRFSWRGDVRIVNDPPQYETAAADWLTLVEKVGLARYLADAAN